MPTITFYPVGNADCYRIDLGGGEKLLFDYADMRCADDAEDKRCDLPAELRKDLDEAKRDGYDVVAFTHLDKDHVLGTGAFFELNHAGKYQGNGRIKINDLWVPAFAICEEGKDLCEDARLIQAEARHRLVEGKGVRVFSRPDRLKEWLASKGLSVADRASLITDAGQLVPGWTKDAQGVEFFVHSPFASRQNDGTLNDGNTCSLVFQAVFLGEDRESRALLMADSTHDVLAEMVGTTRAHERDDRLQWDLVKLPHHCSYLTLGPEKGAEKTKPVAEVAWLYEQQGQPRGKIVSTSWPVPATDTEDNQPPHRQAANYYREDVLPDLKGEFLVTMAHPTTAKPGPLVIDIDGFGVTVRRANRAIGAGATGTPAPRAG